MLKRDFTVEKPNQKWCVDFTYLFLQNGSKRYNCTIIDLFDRSVIASVIGKEITAELAKSALSKAIQDNPKAAKTGLILHSDQGSRFTSNEFIEACEEHGIRQSMSRAGCPYDNAPMERYFNTLKSELIYNYTYSSSSDEKLNEAITDFAYVWYNHVRPHSYNGGLTRRKKERAAVAFMPLCLTRTYITMHIKNQVFFQIQNYPFALIYIIRFLAWKSYSRFAYPAWITFKNSVEKGFFTAAHRE